MGKTHRIQIDLAGNLGRICIVNPSARNLGRISIVNPSARNLGRICIVNPSARNLGRISIVNPSARNLGRICMVNPCAKNHGRICIVNPSARMGSTPSHRTRPIPSLSRRRLCSRSCPWPSGDKRRRTRAATSPKVRSPRAKYHCRGTLLAGSSDVISNIERWYLYWQKKERVRYALGYAMWSTYKASGSFVKSYFFLIKRIINVLKIFHVKTYIFKDYQSCMQISNKISW